MNNICGFEGGSTHRYTHTHADTHTCMDTKGELTLSEWCGFWHEFSCGCDLYIMYMWMCVCVCVCVHVSTCSALLTAVTVNRCGLSRDTVMNRSVVTAQVRLFVPSSRCMFPTAPRVWVQFLYECGLNLATVVSKVIKILICRNLVNTRRTFECLYTVVCGLHFLAPVCDEWLHHT